MADNLRHAQYRDDGTQIDDPQKLVDDGVVSGAGVPATLLDAKGDLIARLLR